MHALKPIPKNMSTKKTSKKKSNKNSYFQEHPLVLLAAAFALMFVVIFLEKSPKLQAMRDSRIYLLGLGVLITGGLLYFTWFFRKKPTRLEQILLTIAALLLWLPIIISSDRVMLLIKMALFAALLGDFLFHFAGDKKYTMFSNVVTAFLGLMLLFSAMDYTYVSGHGDVPFWRIGLLSALAITIHFASLLRKDKIRLKDNSRPEKIALCLVVLFLSFALVSFNADNLNYALDTSKAEEYSAPILKKNISGGRTTYYEFTAEIEGEERVFNVSQSEYFKKEVGDSLTVELYDGAFGKPYYIYEYGK